jgi:hypothetical protein
LTVLGTALRLRSGPGDIDEAVEVLHLAVGRTPPGAVERVGRTYNLAGAHLRRHQERRDPQDLRAAESGLTAILAADPRGQVRALALSMLGLVHMDKLAGSPPTARAAVLDAAFECWRQAAATEAADASTRIVAATRWSRAAGGHGRFADCAEAGNAAVEALDALAWHGLSRPGQERNLAVWSRVTSDGAGAGITNGDPAGALQLLERGRAILWTQRTSPRATARRLRATYPDLADRLESVRRQLDTTDPTPIARPDPAVESVTGGWSRVRTDESPSRNG